MKIKRVHVCCYFLLLAFQLQNHSDAFKIFLFFLFFFLFKRDTFPKWLSALCGWFKLLLLKVHCGTPLECSAAAPGSAPSTEIYVVRLLHADSCSSPTLRAHQNIDHPIEIVEEGEEVEGQLTPALLLTVGQNVGVHDGCWVIQPRATHHRSACIPPDVVAQQRHVEPQGEPLRCAQEHHTEEDVDEVLWEHQRIKCVTLINWILVIGLQFIECNYVPNGEEN